MYVGCMSIIAGEVVHIIKCIPIEVKYRKEEVLFTLTNL